MSDETRMAIVEMVQKRVQNFADEMREKGIHVGLGATPRCVNCGELWPCAGSVGNEPQ